MKKPTIRDLSALSGVSVATVDRVLSGRMQVREETKRRVMRAADELGYHAANAIRQRVLADLPEYTFGIVLQKERHAFYQDFASELQLAAQRITDRRIRVAISFTQNSEPLVLAEHLRSIAGRMHAVAATGLDHHDATAAVNELRARGIPTFSLLSDFAQGVREAYFGTNNIKVGRSAAWLMSKAAERPGKIAIFIGGHRFHGHTLREAGFRAYMREMASQFEVLDAIVNLETRQLTHEALLGVMKRHSDLVGVYCAGGGMEGAISALAEMRQGDSIACLVHELTQESRQALLNGRITGVFQTPLREICTELMSAMLHAVENGMAGNPGQRFFAPVLWTPESL